MVKIVKGLIITSNNDKQLVVYNPGFMAIDENGFIVEISEYDLNEKFLDAKYFDYGQNLILPGMVDCHNHLPQYAFAGIGDGSLLEWLKKYTFPHEASFVKDDIAKEQAKNFFESVVKNGTTTTVSYVTVHKSATEIAFQSAEKIGLRAVIGKVMMDQNSPKDLQEEAAKSLLDSEELIQKWHKKNNKLFYALTPRFAITCSFELMQKISMLAQKNDVYIQTHLAENKAELAFVKELFPMHKNYLDVYKSTGLLGAKTLMAHCIYLSDEDLEILYTTKTKVVHCPTSNRFISSGIMSCKKYLDFGLGVALGTDVAGGYSLSMFDEMKEAIENSKTLSMFDESSKQLSIDEAFYMATLGGAKALSMHDKIGSLEKGKMADFLVIDVNKIDPIPGDTKYKQPLQQLSKCIYRAHHSMIKAVFVAGKQIK